MSKRLSVFLAILLGLAAIAVIGRGLAGNDELFEGEPLEFWLRGGQPWPPYLLKTNWSHEKAEEAVRHLGAEAIPVLLGKLRARDWALKSRLAEWELKTHIIRSLPPPASQSHVAGFEGFRILGSAGAPAEPELIRMVESQGSLSSRCYSIGALGFIGPAATNALPFLLKWLTDTNETIRWNSALTLGRIHAKPEIVVPALVKLLDDGDVWVRRDTVNALAAFGPLATSAIPALTRHSSDPVVTLEVSNALSCITPAKTGSMPR